MERWVRIVMKIKALIMLLCVAVGVQAQSPPPHHEADASYTISINITQINLPGDRLIYDGRFEIDEDLILTVPKIRNPPYATSGTVMVKASEPYIPLKFTGRSNNVGTIFNSNGILTWDREAMCITQILTFTSNDGLGVIGIELTITPGSIAARKPSTKNLTQQTDVCEFDEITLDVGANYAWYEWEYREAGDATFRPFHNPQPEVSTITFTMEDVFGSNHDDKFGNDHAVYFRMHIGACDPQLWGPYVFSRQSPVINVATPTNPLCHNGTGSYTITDFNRDTGADEKFQVTIRNVNDPLSVFQSDEIESIELPLTIYDLPPANYEAFVEARIGGNNASCGALITRTFTITNPDSVTFTNSFTQPSCFGGTNGSVVLTASGGTGTGYQYSKNNGSSFQVSNTFNSLSATIYTMMVKDDNDCPSVPVPVTIIQPPDIVISSAAVTSDFKGQDISCFGSANGAITVSASGGTGILQYSRDAGATLQTSPVLNGFAAGTHTITVRDANGCMRNSVPVVIISPTIITIGSMITEPACFGQNNGSIAVSGSGGTGSLLYSKDLGPFVSDPLFTNLAANTYLIRVQDENLCTVQQTIVVNQPAAVTVSGTVTPVNCSGGSDGAVTLMAANGTGPYTYSFNNGVYSSANTFTGISANSYPINAKDSKGCIGNNNVIITANPPIAGTITVQTLVSCNGGANGALNLTPSGGVGPYTYAWSNGSTTEDINGLIAGTYTVNITDTKGCSKPFDHTLGQPTPLAIIYSASDYSGSNIRCFGNSNGSINITASGGNGGYTYSWSNGSTSEDLASLAAGTYTVNVLDSKSCMGTQNIILTQPALLTSSLTAQQNVLCFGGNTGSISLNATGGTGAYEYSINSGSSWQTTQSFNGLVAANYTILTRDVNSCQANLNVTITSPSDIVLSVGSIVNTTCNQNNGSALASATGGVASYNYQWFNSSNTSISNTPNVTNLQADTYRVVVTDQNTCTKQQTVLISSSNGPQITTGTITPTTCSDTADGTASISITGGSTPYTILWSNGQTTPTATNLQGGQYIVEVRDNTSCLALQTITVPAPDELLINILTKEDPNCTGNSDGMITLEASGGNGTYAYNWNTGATTPALTNLAAGIYTVTVKDVKNCTEQNQITLIDPPVFTIDLGPDQKICEGMTVIVNTAAAGTYAWTSDNGFTSNQSSVSLSEAGIYTLTVISPAGCEAEDNFVLSYDTDLLKADFLMASQAHAGDTIVLIDISWPLPEQTEWTYATGTTVIEETQDFSMVRFDDAGEYLVSLLAKLAQCTNSHEQSIIILEAVEEETQAKGNEKLIENLSAYPNPSPDEVSVSIELSKSKAVSLELYQAESNKRVYQQTLNAERAHVKALNLSTLPRGMYILYIHAGKEIRTIKIIKQ